MPFQKYVDNLKELEKRCRMWVHIPVGVEAALLKSVPSFSAGVALDDGNYEHHQDDCEDFILDAYPKHLHHTIALEVGKPPRDEWKCLFGHEYEVCKCHLALNHYGQDESIYKAYQLSSRVWTMNGVRGLRKKCDGPGEMVSSCQDDLRGFGLPVSAEELQKLNEWRRARYGPESYMSRGGLPAEKTDLLMSPGHRFLNYGKAEGKDGYWTYELLAKQTDDVLDLFECLHPNLQIVGEYDWSSGHSKAQNLALNSISMNKSWGGRQPKMRTSESVDEHCVGRGEANMWHDGKLTRSWSLTEKPGWTKVDCRVRAGMKHVAVFMEGDPPPFYELDAPLDDREQTEAEVRAVEKKRADAKAKKAGRGRGRGTSQGSGRGRGRTAAIQNPPDTEGIIAAGTKFKKVFDEGTYEGTVLSYDVENQLYSVRYSDGDQEDLNADELEGYLGTGIIPGYIGKAKGMMQYLWERGLYFERKHNPSCTNAKCKKQGKGCPMLTAINSKKEDPHNRDLTYCMKTVLGNCRFETLSRTGSLYRTDTHTYPLFLFYIHTQRFRHGVVGAGAKVHRPRTHFDNVSKGASRIGWEGH